MGDGQTRAEAKPKEAQGGPARLLEMPGSAARPGLRSLGPRSLPSWPRLSPAWPPEAKADVRLPALRPSAQLPQPSPGHDDGLLLLSPLGP